jgi:hypothetical protein
VDGSASTLRRGYIDQGRECFIEANINNQSKSLSNNLMDISAINVNSKALSQTLDLAVKALPI